MALALYNLVLGAGPAVVRAAVMSVIAIQIGRPGGGLNALLLTSGNLKSISAEEWRVLGAQAVISAQPGERVAPSNGGWVHVSTDGARMWMEEGR